MVKKPTREDLRQRVKELEGETEKLRLADESLRKSEELHRIILSNISDAVFITDDDGVFTYVCPNVDVIFGYSREEVQGFKSISKLMGNDLFSLDELKNSGEIKNIEKKVEDKSGEIHALLVNVKRVSINGGTILFTCRDVSEHKQIEKDLRESDVRYRSLFESMNEGVAVYKVKNNGKDFVFVDINIAAEKISNTTRKAAVGESVLKIFPGVKDFGLFQVFQRVWKTGKPERHPVSLYKDNRISHWVENSVYRLPSGEIVAVYSNETERKSAEESLRQSEKRYRDLYENIPVAYFSISASDGTVRECNTAATKLLDYDQEVLMGMKIFDLYADTQYGISKAKKIFRRFKKGQSIRNSELQMKKRDGTPIWISLSVDPLTDDAGNVLQSRSAVTDISDRKKAERALKDAHDHLEQRVQERTAELEEINEKLKCEIEERTRTQEALKESEQKLLSITDNSQDYIMMLDPNGVILFINRTVPDLKKEELTGTPIFNYARPQEVKAIKDCFAGVVKTHKPDRYQTEYHSSDGRIIHFESRVSAIVSEGKATALVVNSSDITERLEIETELRNTLDSLAAAQRIYHHGNWDWNIVNNELKWADEIYRIFGLEPQEFDATYEAFLSSVHPDDRELVKEAVNQALDERKAYGIDHRIVRPDGAQRIVHEQADVVLDEHGKPVRMIGIVHDITERKQADEALRESEERYRILAENVADGVALIQKGKLVFVNNACAAMFGYKSPEKLVGKKAIDLVAEKYRKSVADLYDELTKTDLKNKIFQSHHVSRDGREFWLEGNYNVIRWRGVTTVLAAVRDITRTKLREMAMAEEMEHFRTQTIKLRSSLKDRYRFGEIIGKSPVMQEVYEQILKAAATDANVVVLGESGTGKELVARAIHEMSDRSNKAFVPVNCGAIPENLIESEFFGHRKGSFTGAAVDKKGFLRSADGGTLFMDEVGYIGIPMQVKLLRAIESGEYIMIGDTAAQNADIRIIAATNRDLREMSASGLIRDDFYYRISVILITLPPLRERREDIPLFVSHFLNQFGKGKKIDLPGKVMEAIYNHAWPGNVRELQSAIQRFLTVGRFDIKGLRADLDIPAAGETAEAKMTSLSQAVENFEKQYIKKVLVTHDWNRGKTAAVLRVDPKTLYRRMKKIGLL
ncbi:PAS domain S-box protein [Thermodesulfobacteriota bacterium]